MCNRQYRMDLVSLLVSWLVAKPEQKITSLSNYEAGNLDFVILYETDSML